MNNPNTAARCEPDAGPQQHLALSGLIGDADAGLARR